jgi:hypothetical protein
MKWAIVYALLLLVALPISAVVTLMALPFWRFIEQRTGVGSLGHSGPADRCFCVTYAVVLVIGIALLLARRAGHSRDS